MLTLKVLEKYNDPNDPLFQSVECQELLKIYPEYYSKNGFNPPWTAFVILNENLVVGTCSFTQAPKKNEVEIAYWVFEGHERKGYAKLACAELVKIAKKENPDILIYAKTAPEHNASASILKSNGFKFIKIVQDEDIGDAWRWELGVRS